MAGAQEAYARYIIYVGGRPRARYRGAWYDAVVEAVRRLGGCARLSELLLELGVGGDGRKIVNSAVQKLVKKGILRKDPLGRYCLTVS